MKDDTNKNGSISSEKLSKSNDVSQRTSKRVIFACIVIVLITFFQRPTSMQPGKGMKPTVQHVFYYGWISAISTGLGVLPLVFVPNPDKFRIGVTNAIAASMIIGASYSLIIAGILFDEPDDTSNMTSTIRTVIGIISGLAFILGTKSILDAHEEIKIEDLQGADTRKVLLIIFVMTLHSFTEGVVIGVSFSGQIGNELGVFISASLAVHNILNGLAVAIVLLPRKVLNVALILIADDVWCDDLYIYTEFRCSRRRNVKVHLLPGSGRFVKISQS